MNFLPFERVSYRTKLSHSEVMDKMWSVTDKPKRFRFGRIGDRPYEGTISDSHFRITRVLDYRNGWKPVIKGFVSEEGEYTIITLRFALNDLLLIFSIIFYSTFLLAIVFLFTRQPFPDLPPTIASIITLTFFYFISLFLFKAEKDMAKKHLEHLLEVDELLE